MKFNPLFYVVFFKVPDINVKIYGSSWVIDKLPKKIILEEEQQRAMHTLLTVTNDFTHEKYISELSNIYLDQRNDANLSKIISYIENESDPIFGNLTKIMKLVIFWRNLNLNLK